MLLLCCIKVDIKVVAETKEELELVNFKKRIEVTKELDIPNPF